MPRCANAGVAVEAVAVGIDAAGKTRHARAGGQRAGVSHYGRAVHSAETAAVPHKALAGRRLLVIDDEADTRACLQRVLTERGAEVN